MNALTASDSKLAERQKVNCKQRCFTKEKEWVHDQWTEWAYEHDIPFNALVAVFWKSMYCYTYINGGL